MTHKLTFDMLAAQVARTMAALPNADWNEPASAVSKPVEQPRRAHATWGPLQVTVGTPLIHSPRWKTDHHPWRVSGGTIRYAGHEVEEATDSDRARQALIDNLPELYDIADVAAMSDDEAINEAVNAGVMEG